MLTIRRSQQVTIPIMKSLYELSVYVDGRAAAISAGSTAEVILPPKSHDPMAVKRRKIMSSIAERSMKKGMNLMKESMMNENYEDLITSFMILVSL